MGTRTAKSWRWAKNTMMPFGIFSLIKLFYAFNSNEFKGLVDVVLILASGVVFAAIAFGLGYYRGSLASPIAKLDGLEAVSSKGFSATIDEDPSGVDRPTSALVGLALAAAAVVAILIAMSIWQSTIGRVIVVVAGILIALLALRSVLRRIHQLRDSGRPKKAAIELAWLMTALFWGWLPFALEMRFGESAISAQSLAILAIWGAGLIPARGFCMALVDQSAFSRDLGWSEVRGYLLIMCTILVGTYFAFHREGNPFYAEHLLLAEGLGTLVGAAFCVVILAALLLAAGVLTSYVWGKVNHRRPVAPKRKAVALLTAWATIPFVYALLLLSSQLA